MRISCVPLQEFGRVDGLAGDHPVRLHVETCARCRARYLSYRSFVGASGVESSTTAVQIAEAHVALDSLIVRHFGQPRAPEPVFTSEGTAHRNRRGALRRFRWIWVLTPAAGVALLAGYLTLDRLGGSPETIVLRGGRARMFGLEQPVSLVDGSIRLRWKSVPGAGSYRVQLLDAGLRLQAELPAVNDTMLVLPRGEVVPQGSAPQTLWRVTAYSGSRKIADSEVGALPGRQSR